MTPARAVPLLIFVWMFLLPCFPAEAAPHVYVANERSNDITIIDTATNSVVATVPVGQRPRGLGLSPDGNTLYVALGPERAIAAVDLATRKVVVRLPAGSDPETFAVSRDGT